MPGSEEITSDSQISSAVAIDPINKTAQITTMEFFITPPPEKIVIVFSAYKKGHRLQLIID